MIFRDKQHEELFCEIYNRMRTHDCYYKPVAYLIALDRVCREHIEDIFDFTLRITGKQLNFAIPNIQNKKHLKRSVVDNGD